MAISTEVVARKYLDVTADTPISVDIPCFEATDVYVYYGKSSLEAVQAIDYTVQLEDDFATFTVTPLASLLNKINTLIAADDTEENYITVRRTLDYETEATADGVRYTPFTSREFDRNAMRDQQLRDALSRSLTFPPSQLAEDVDGSVVNVEPGQFIRRSDDGSQFNGAALELTVSEVDAWFQNRDVVSATQAALLTNGSVVALNGLHYRVDSSATGALSATNDLGVDGIVPLDVWTPEHFGAVRDGVTDDLPALQRMIDAGVGPRTYHLRSGTYKISDTWYLRRKGTRVRGEGIFASQIKFSNLLGGTAIAGDTDLNASMNVYTYCGLEDFSVVSDSPATDASRVLDITPFSYSDFRISIQSKRTDAELIYGQGNTGQSPYSNDINVKYLFGGTVSGTDYTQSGIVFAQGTWAGGSNGPNANIVRGIGRAAGLGILVDLQSGTGNLFSDISGESINEAYFRFNYNPAVETGTSSGSNAQASFNDTSKAWTANQFLSDAIKITGGKGAGQVRIISTNTATALALDKPWGEIPDATSTYEIYANKTDGNQIVGARAEGLAQLNPDFIQAFPACVKTNVKFCEVQSLGLGVFVRDNSGAANNEWFNGSKISHTATVTNPGPNANIDVYAKSSVFGGVKFAQNYAMEWLLVAATTGSIGDTATVMLDAGGVSAGGGDVTLTCQLLNGNSTCMALAHDDEKKPNSGTNRSVFLNVQTGASFSATADLQITWCVSLV